MEAGRLAACTSLDLLARKLRRCAGLACPEFEETARGRPRAAMENHGPELARRGLARLTHAGMILRIKISLASHVQKVACVPLYEYQCKKCNHRFEKIQKFSDPAVKKCPQCGGTVEKLISAPSVQFKGSGWYVTDYARKGAGSSADGAKPADSAPASGSEAASGKATEKTEKADSKKADKKHAEK
jgi:putative FmdB family regulatory protein